MGIRQPWPWEPPLDIVPSDGDLATVLALPGGRHRLTGGAPEGELPRARTALTETMVDLRAGGNTAEYTDRAARAAAARYDRRIRSRS